MWNVDFFSLFVFQEPKTLTSTQMCLLSDGTMKLTLPPSEVRGACLMLRNTLMRFSGCASFSMQGRRKMKSCRGATIVVQSYLINRQ